MSLKKFKKNYEFKLHNKFYSKISPKLYLIYAIPTKELISTEMMVKFNSFDNILLVRKRGIRF